MVIKEEQFLKKIWMLNVVSIYIMDWKIRCKIEF